MSQSGYNNRYPPPRHRPGSAEPEHRNVLKIYIYIKGLDGAKYPDQKTNQDKDREGDCPASAAPERD